MSLGEPVPPVELVRALAALCEPPAAQHRRIAEAVGLGEPPDGARFAEIFVFQLHPYASVYLGPEGMLGGQARQRVAGFWHAVGRVPPAEPDHLSALLGLYAGLLEEGAESDGAESEMARQAAAALLREHVAPWVFDFLDRVQDLDTGFYRSWADLLRRTLGQGVARMNPGSVPRHLLEAPDLPDPRTEGAGPFLAGLLAPVRSGMILTRLDLARVAQAGGLGLRVGERRYVLEHLLAQEPGVALRALTREAEAAHARHASRRSLLGAIAAFWEERAASTAVLLDGLATEGEGVLASPAQTVS